MITGYCDELHFFFGAINFLVTMLAVCVSWKFTDIKSNMQADNTQQLHAELCVHPSVLCKGPQHKSICPVALHQLYVLPHYLHLLV